MKEPAPSAASKPEEAVYLVWSNEHHMWWAASRFGYVQNYEQAGRYTREEALAISSNALPGNTIPPGMLPEFPVALSDIEEMHRRYDQVAPGRRKRLWE